MGRGRDTGVAQLREILAGTETELTVVPPAEYKGHTVSSSRIREAIREGRFEESRVMLVSPHCLDLRDLPVRRDGTGVRVRREEISQVLPRTGEYEVTVRMVGGQRPARLSVQHDGIAWGGGSPSVELEICFLQ
jgi:FAD synthase